jgi:hypothetical protein
LTADPGNGRSWLRVTACARAQAGCTLVWASSGGVRYRVLYCDSAAGGALGPFVPLSRPVADEMDPGQPGVEGTLSFTDDYSLTPPPGTCRFYRIQVVR